MDKNTIADYFKNLQDTICRALESEDGKGVFHEDAWEHHSGGGGRTRLIQNGNILEKGGVNFSAVQGPTSEDMKRQLKITEDADYFASGVSIVQHPVSPMVPIIHMNVRYFELSNGVWWFGGGIDLTPHYVDKKQAAWFHQQLKSVCDSFGEEIYAKYKKWADDYFFLPHRNETRGVGGIFFDHLNEETTGRTKEELFSFVQSVGELFAPTYTHLMRLNSDKNYGEPEKKWQMIRRGRYVEFNLVWDRGTKFGLVTGGRTESILMSLPAQANWEYNYLPSPDSAEAETLELLKKDISWIDYGN
jgi:coproporphyrinogen III oxidase